MSRQWDVIAALRARAATVAGWDTTWPVAEAQRPFDPPASRRWIEEAIVAGPGAPDAVTPGSGVWYAFTGLWQLTLVAPPELGTKTTLDLGEALLVALVGTPLSIAGPIPVLILAAELGPADEQDGDVRRDLVVTYQFRALLGP